METDGSDKTKYVHDDNARPYLCTVCDKQFTSEDRLNVHVRNHSGAPSHSREKSFQCTGSGNRPSPVENLLIHSRNHGGEKPCKRQLCHELFSQLGELNTRMRIYVEDKMYRCSLCNESFSQLSSLETHEHRVHSGRKPYRRKLLKADVKQRCHVEIDVGANLYACRHCSDCFAQHTQLKEHLTKSHNEGT